MAKQQQQGVRTGRKRQTVSLRFDADLRDRVWGKALQEGRASLNEMINLLIERGLEAERQATVAFGSVYGLALARAVIAAAEMSAVRQSMDGGAWFNDPEAYDRAADAMTHTISMWHPKARGTQEHLSQLASGKRSA